MTEYQMFQVILPIAFLEAVGMLLGFFLSRIVHKSQIEFWEMMYRTEEQHNQKLFEEVKRLGDENLDYERRIKKMTLNKYLDARTMGGILNEEELK